MPAGRAKPACAARGVIKLVHLIPRRPCDGGQHQLRNAVAAVDGELLKLTGLAARVR